MDEFKSPVVQRHVVKDQQMSGGELCRALVFIYHDPITICFVATDEQVSNNYIMLYFKKVSQDGAEDGSRVACSGKTLQFFVCFICFFVVLRVRCC